MTFSVGHLSTAVALTGTKQVYLSTQAHTAPQRPRSCSTVLAPSLPPGVWAQWSVHVTTVTSQRVRDPLPDYFKSLPVPSRPSPASHTPSERWLIHLAQWQIVLAMQLIYVSTSREGWATWFYLPPRSQCQKCRG